MVRWVALCVLMVAVWPSHPAQARTELVVFAAASLTDAFEAVAEAFEAAHPDVDVLFNFAGSSTLAAQLDRGAPADLFASANPAQMDAAQAAGRIAGTPQTFAYNRLALIVPRDNPAGIASVRDLAQPGVRLLLAAPEVPVRAYTDALLAQLAADPAYGAAWRDAVLDNRASEEGNVRQVAAKVALGEADAGIVYASDVTPDVAAAVHVIALPGAADLLAAYPIALTDDTRQPELAQQFMAYLQGDAGQALLAEWGFIPLDAVPQPERKRCAA